MINKPKYPRYTKKESLSCKLTEKDILEIRRRKATGETIKSLASSFGVHPDTIYVWLNDKYRKKKRERSREYLKEHPRDRKTAMVYHNRMIHRKIKVKPEYRPYKTKSNQRCPYYKKRTQRHKHRLANDPEYAQRYERYKKSLRDKYAADPEYREKVKARAKRRKL